MMFLALQSDVARKPQGYITLDGQTRVIKTEGALTFEVRGLVPQRYRLDS